MEPTILPLPSIAEAIFPIVLSFVPSKIFPIILLLLSIAAFALSVLLIICAGVLSKLFVESKKLPVILFEVSTTALALAAPSLTLPVSFRFAKSRVAVRFAKLPPLEILSTP